MALNDIQLTSGLSITSGVEPYASASTTFTASAETGFERGIKVEQLVGTDPENVNIGDIDGTKEYFLQMRNMDDTHFVTVSVQKSAQVTTVAGIMRAGESFGPIRCGGQDVDGFPNWEMQADTHACEVVVVACTAGVYSA